jgi:glycosyltransferase involved in cell wall biosynthesis
MMLSVLIPVYNYNITSLVHKLHSQITACDINFEIICLDDGSTVNYIEQNKEINKLPRTSYKLSSTNSGIAITRDKLVASASYEWIILLDADVAIESNDYITKYLDEVKKGHEVIFGGICYHSLKPETHELLRWKYGKKYEQKEASYRNLKPYKNTSAGNLCIKKSIYQLFALKEVGDNYGMDIFLGPQLKHNGINVQHINNCVIHLGLENSLNYLKKTERAVETLLSLYQKDKIILHENTLLTVFLQLKKLRIYMLVGGLFKISKSLLISNLISDRPNMVLFQFYKIGYMCLLETRNKSL